MTKHSNELSFKSIENSINQNNRDWAILSIKITKLDSKINIGCKYCLYRKIAYLEADNTTYQIGVLFVPINSIKNILFFIKLNFSGKTFGHYISLKYPNSFRFKLIENIDISNTSNLLFQADSKTKVSKRILLVPNRKLKFYVEEEREIL
jgi:hypothetical protein